MMMRPLHVLLLLCLVAPVLAQGEGTTGNGNVNLGVTMLTRDQAAAFLPPPIPVVDLSKPGNVYKSNDPLIAAAVADYLSKIKEPHDQFGNIIGPNYKSATTPDTVESKLIAHIVAFVGGQRFIALSPRAAMSLRATQDIQRQKDIDKIIYDDWAAKTKAKVDNINRARQNGNLNAPGDTGGTPPGGPPSNTPGPGQPNSNSNGGAGGGNANTGGPGGGGNENVPNLNGTPGNTNTPPQPGVAGDIERTFGVIVSNELKAWSETELADLRDVLSKLPRRFYEGVKFLREPVITPRGGSPNPLILGITRNTGERAGSVTMADGYQRTDGGFKNDWPNPPWSDEEGRRMQFRAVLAHEITHNFQFYSDGRNVGPANNSQVVKNFASTFGWTFDSANNRWTFDSTRRAERVSQYAIGTPEEPTSPAEDMSEAVAFFFYDPARLRATGVPGRSRYDWVRDVLGLPTQPDAAKSIPPPAIRGTGR